MESFARTAIRCEAILELLRNDFSKTDIFYFYNVFIKRIYSVTFYFVRTRIWQCQRNVEVDVDRGLASLQEEPAGGSGFIVPNELKHQ